MKSVETKIGGDNVAIKIKRHNKSGIDKYKYEVSQEIGRVTSNLRIRPKTINEGGQNNGKK